MTQVRANHRRVVLGGLAMGMALVLAACQAGAPSASPAASTAAQPTGSGAAPSAEASTPPKDLGKATLALDFGFYGHHAPFALAVKNGSFTSRGVEMEIQPGESSGVTITSVQGGQIDFGYASPSVLANTLAQDPTVDVVVVATIMQHAPWVASYIKGRGIENPEDLANKKWGVNPGAPMEAFYKAYMESRGYALGELAGVESQQLLFAGQLDVLPIPVTIYPMLETNAEKAGLESAFFPLNEASELDHANWGLITRRSLAEQNPELVKAVVEGVLEGWLQSFENPDAAADAYLSEFDSLADRDVVRALIDVSLPLAVAPAVCEHGLGYGDPDVWEQSVSVFEEYLGISSAPAADKLYTNDYVPADGFVPPTC